MQASIAILVDSPSRVTERRNHRRPLSTNPAARVAAAALLQFAAAALFRRVARAWRPCHRFALPTELGRGTPASAAGHQRHMSNRWTTDASICARPARGGQGRFRRATSRESTTHRRPGRCRRASSCFLRRGLDLVDRLGDWRKGRYVRSIECAQAFLVVSLLLEACRPRKLRELLDRRGDQLRASRTATGRIS